MALATIILFLLTVYAPQLPAAPKAAVSLPPGTHEVSSVVDGDTLKVLVGSKLETVRMIGVDTPETKDPRRPVQCFGREAAQRLGGLVAGKVVTLEADATQADRDKYGRLLRYVLLEGVNINQLMISEGYAHEYTYQIPYKYQSEFKAAEAAARQGNKGLWSPATCNGGPE